VSEIEKRKKERKLKAVNKNTPYFQLKFQLCHCIVKETTKLSLMSYSCLFFCVQFYIYYVTYEFIINFLPRLYKISGSAIDQNQI